MGLLTVSVATAPLLAAFLVDRGAFALGAYAMDLQRRHKPTVYGPLLAFAAIVVSFFGAHARNIELATVGFALIPVAALVCGLSFVRSVAIDLRGQRGAQILRVAAVVGFGVMAMVRFAL